VVPEALYYVSTASYYQCIPSYTIILRRQVWDYLCKYQGRVLLPSNRALHTATRVPSNTTTLAMRGRYTTHAVYGGTV